MGYKKSLLSGIVAFVVAAAVARAVGGERTGTKVGALTAVAVVLTTLVSGNDRGASVEFEDELAAE